MMVKYTQKVNNYCSNEINGLSINLNFKEHIVNNKPCRTSSSNKVTENERIRLLSVKVLYSRLNAWITSATSNLCL